MCLNKVSRRITSYHKKNIDYSKLTLAKLAKIANKKHDNKYEYLEIIINDGQFKKNGNYIKYRCKICNHINIQPIYSHVFDTSILNGCFRCKYFLTKKRNMRDIRHDTPESIFSMLSELHDNKYEYIEIIKSEGKKYIVYKCKSCDQKVTQLLSNHYINRHGCKDCSYKRQKRKQIRLIDIIDLCIKKHGDRYEYIEITNDQKHQHRLITYRCKTCGDLRTQPLSVHLKGSGCYECYKKSMSEKMTIDKDIEIARAQDKHGDRYEYLEVIPKNSTVKYKKIKFRCKNCNRIHEQGIHNHLQGYGCKFCYQRISKK